MIKTFFRNNQYPKDEVTDVIIKQADPLYIRVSPTFEVDTKVEFRLITSDGKEIYGTTILPAWCELIPVPDKFVKPGVLDVVIVETSSDEVTPAKVWSGPSYELYSLDYCFGGHDRIQELIQELPKIKAFLSDYPVLKDTIERVTAIVFDPLDVGGLGG